MFDDDFEVERNRVRNLTPGKIALYAVGVIVGLTLILTVTGFAGGWFRAHTDTVSAQNVKEQWQFAYDMDRGLDSLAQKYCAAQAAESKAVGQDAVNMAQQMTLANKNLYFQREGEYNARLADKFRAGLVAPTDVPNPATPLDQRITKLHLVGCTA
jgi:hypothetical protein